MLEMKKVSSGYGKTEILHSVDFNAEEGKITTVIGCNGCGKSTLIKTALGLIPLKSGEVFLSGKPISEMTPQDTAKCAAYLTQGRNVPDITVGRLVLHGRFPYLNYPRRYGKEDFRLADEAMHRMGVADLAEKPLSSLSGGMRQKVYIAMALAQQSPIIVMDEPTTYLDIGWQMKLADIVRELADSGKTVILVLHDILLALKISDCVTAMSDGRIVFRGTPAELISDGVIEEIFGVRVRSLETENGMQYYYE
ncbi:MAG: ABC transporter ATP-binding protein [Clostridia bacterium]|nr:ABC transporter ATP-binding protein [Clostridia bacterium]